MEKEGFDVSKRARRFSPRLRRGGTQVMTALMAPVLVGFTALTVDVGRLYVRKQALSNGVDAAALAGGRELPNKSAAEAEAKRVAAANHIDTSRVTTRFEERGSGGSAGQASIRAASVSEPKYNYMKVSAVEDVPMTFARIFGINQWPVQANAAVAVTGGGGQTVNTIPSGSTPFGIDKETITASGNVSVIIHACSFQQFWVLPFGNQPDAVQNMITNGNPNTVSVGDLIDVASPKNPNYWYAVINGVNERIQRAESSPIYSAQDASNATASNPRVVIVALVDPANGNANHTDTTQAKVVGFAAMYLLDIRQERTTEGAKQYFLDGKLVDIVTPDAAHDPNRPDPDKTLQVTLRTGGGELDPLKLRLVE
jgi:Flp pilus assembly protein TadG